MIKALSVILLFLLLFPAPLVHADVFDYQKETIEATVTVLPEKEAESNGRYGVVRVSFPSALKLGYANDIVEGEFWYQKDGKPRPTIVILPVISNQLKFSELAARNFVSCGDMNVFILYRDAKEIRKVKWREIKNEEDFLAEAVYTRDILRQTYIDTRRIVDWLSERPEVDSSKIVIEGFSFGGIQAAAILAIEPRFAAGVLILAGGDFTKILLETEEKGIKGVREGILKNLGWDKETAYRKLQPIFKDIDPLTYLNAERAEKLRGRVLMINAARDQIIPPSASEKLWLALGKPERQHSWFGHYAFAIFSTPWANDFSRTFIAQVLDFSVGKNKCESVSGLVPR